MRRSLPGMTGAAYFRGTLVVTRASSRRCLFTTIAWAVGGFHLHPQRCPSFGVLPGPAARG
jgi:hypothetical protein